MVEGVWKLGYLVGIHPSFKDRLVSPIITEVEIRCPDFTQSGIANEAHQMCVEVSNSISEDPVGSGGSGSAWLLDHSFRTFGFGVMRAIKTGMTHANFELLFVASMLHDIELKGDCRGRPGVSKCVAARGADIAYELAKDNMWPDSEAEALAEAICIHINPRVGKARGLEARLLSYGTALDVAGIGYHGMPSEAVEAVVRWKPRHDGLRDLMWTQWKAESACAPGCRGQFLSSPFFGGFLGLQSRIRNAPFTDL